MSKTVFDDSIIHNSLAINELPLFRMTRLRAGQKESNQEFWRTNIKAQLHSIYENLQHTAVLPLREVLMQVTRESPLNWNAVQTLAR
mmetsp:Transcript_28417/g.59226  ORF Transcript_28417/g.59226 Transcript_28417/m.59226 type:complete len:87 (+) Transcript_28417:401-661(+)|eukprot:CAMPEP_0196154770 /NCGR_PEP_ID=MMETSP0910-20130528/39501_1 /TAXON_ID=49265 /ORGANISM="Thalassiosira rotula, Strain GSO102" /LENGTH=86 /DNA_ID=CAMNT_0041418855 /DNA_START=83 /DNA_END=343 /DNA_ORIENTATION=-